MFKYQLNFKSHLREGWQIGLLLIIVSLYPAYFYYRFGIDSVEFSIKAAIVVFLIVFIPHAIIHFRYYYINREGTLTFNKKKKTISYKDASRNLTFPISSIKSVSTVKTRAQTNHAALRWFPWDSYAYSVFLLDDGNEIIITTLLVSELYWPLKLPNEKIESEIYCWV